MLVLSTYANRGGQFLAFPVGKMEERKSSILKREKLATTANERKALANKAAGRDLGCLKIPAKSYQGVVVFHGLMDPSFLTSHESGTANKSAVKNLIAQLRAIIER